MRLHVSLLTWCYTVCKRSILIGLRHVVWVPGLLMCEQQFVRWVLMSEPLAQELMLSTHDYLQQQQRQTGQSNHTALINFQDYAESFHYKCCFPSSYLCCCVQQSVSGRLKTKLSLRVMHLSRLRMLISLSGSKTTQSEKTHAWVCAAALIWQSFSWHIVHQLCFDRADHGL